MSLILAIIVMSMPMVLGLALVYGLLKYDYDKQVKRDRDNEH